MGSCCFYGCDACGIPGVFVVARDVVGYLCPFGSFIGDVQAGVPGVAAALAPGTVEGFYDGVLDEQFSRVVLAAVVIVVGGSIYVGAARCAWPVVGVRVVRCALSGPLALLVLVA